MGATPIKKGNGLTGSGLGHPESMGVVGPTCYFKSRKNPQDIQRKTSMSQTEDGPRGSNDGNKGVKPGQTGGMSRKGRGKMAYEKATGTK